MRPPSGRRPAGHYDPLRQTQIRSEWKASSKEVLGERKAPPTKEIPPETKKNLPAEVRQTPVQTSQGQKPAHDTPKTAHERWRQRTIARIEHDRLREEGAPAKSNDPKFEKMLDDRQQLNDKVFKEVHGEDAERREAWRNKERKIMMQMLSPREEGRALKDLWRREERLLQEKQLRINFDRGPEPDL